MYVWFCIVISFIKETCVAVVWSSVTIYIIIVITISIVISWTLVLWLCHSSVKELVLAVHVDGIKWVREEVSYPCLNSRCGSFMHMICEILEKQMRLDEDRFALQCIVVDKFTSLFWHKYVISAKVDL